MEEHSPPPTNSQPSSSTSSKQEPDPKRRKISTAPTDDGNHDYEKPKSLQHNAPTAIERPEIPPHSIVIANALRDLRPNQVVQIPAHLIDTLLLAQEQMKRVLDSVARAVVAHNIVALQIETTKPKSNSDSKSEGGDVDRNNARNGDKEQKVAMTAAEKKGILKSGMPGDRLRVVIEAQTRVAEEMEATRLEAASVEEGMKVLEAATEMKKQKATPTFHLFGHLPFEIRSKIWNRALRTPEINTLDKQLYIDDPGYDATYELVTIVARNCPKKAFVLWVNQEARQIAEGLLVRLDGAYSRCFINLEADIIWLKDFDCGFSNALYRDASKYDDQNIKHFAISAYSWFECEVFFWETKFHRLAHWPVETIALVVGNEWLYDEDIGEVEFVDPPKFDHDEFFQYCRIGKSRFGELSLLKSWEDAAKALKRMLEVYRDREPGESREVEADDYDWAPSESDERIASWNVPNFIFKTFSARIVDTGLPKPIAQRDQKSTSEVAVKSGPELISIRSGETASSGEGGEIELSGANQDIGSGQESSDDAEDV